MDGNGRWAHSRGLPRTEGHRAGEASLMDVLYGAMQLGVGTISAYAFSTENWRRTPEEVRFLMGFNKDVIRRRRDELAELGVRIRWAGRRPRLWRSVIDQLEDAEQYTRDNDRLTLQFCVNYGGRAEIVDAVRAIARGRAERPGQPGQDRRADDRGASGRARPARRRPVHPDVRRAAHLELPAVAVGLCRVDVRGHPVAGLRSAPPLGGLRVIRAAQPAVRRGRSGRA